MEEDSLAITYETLYELLRAEKNKEELCELDEAFYKNVLEYIREKSRILQEASTKNDIFSMDERDNTQVQLQNIRKIIREIYERREKKIIEMALNKSRTNSDIIDTANLLNPEKTFFETLTGLLDKFRLGILAQILNLQEPNIDITCSMRDPILSEETETKTEPEATETKEPLPVETETKLAEEVQKAPSETKEPEKETTPKTIKKIKITQAVEQFVGSELEMYGPYKEEDVAELPLEIAEILIGKGSAVEVE